MANITGLKEMNNAVTEYTANVAKQVLEFNSKLLNDYFALTQTIAMLIPSITAIYPVTSAK